MELRHLRYFVAVAEELHFGRAARKVGIAQPPFSRQIQELETEVGARLLHRTKRVVRLTPAGHVFLEETRKTLAQAKHAAECAAGAAQGTRGQLRIGFVSSAIYGRFSSVFSLMQRRYPDVVLTLHDMSNDEQMTALWGEQIDIGIVRPPLAGSSGYDMRSLSREPFVVALPVRHPLARRARVDVQSLADEPFLIIPRRWGQGYYDQVMEVCSRAGFAPRVIQEVRTSQTIVNLVASGVGISIVPESLSSFRRAGIVFRPIRPPVPTTELAMICHRANENPALRPFRALMMELAGRRS